MWDTYDELIRDAAGRHGVPFEWIKAVIGVESSFNPFAMREEPRIKDASRGLMQLLEITARNLGFDGALHELYDPAVNIDLGTKLLSENIRRCGMDFVSVYSAYNSGRCDAWAVSDTVRQHVEHAVKWLNMFEGTEKKTAFPASSG